MLSRAQGLKLIRDMRRSTQDTTIVELCDWILRATGASARADRRRAYMRDFMRRKRAREKQATLG
jgi:hypothetical protein